MTCKICGKTRPESGRCPTCGAEIEENPRGIGAGGLFPLWLLMLLVPLVMLAIGAAVVAAVIVALRT